MLLQYAYVYCYILYFSKGEECQHIEDTKYTAGCTEYTSESSNGYEIRNIVHRLKMLFSFIIAA